MTDHKQVKISYQDKEAEVDEEIAELILAIWKHDINTTLSCQENRPGIVWISFLTVADGEKFLSLCSRQFPKTEKVWKTLYGRINGFGSQGDWEYDVGPQDINALDFLNEKDEVEYNVTGPAQIFFFLSVRFPKSDVPKILKRLR